MTGGDEAEPLAGLVARLSRAADWLTVLHGEPTGTGWTRCDDLLGRRLDGWLDDVTTALTRQEAGRAPPAVVPATYLMGWYLEVPALVGGLAFGLARRVPEIGPPHLAVHRHPVGFADGVALLGGRFACLPGDPDAGHPDADVVADEVALAEVLRRRVADHAAAFHAAYAPGVPISSHQRWGMATDHLDSALWTSGRSAGDEERGVRDAALVLDAVHPPFTSASRLYPLVDGNGRRWTRRRESCCFMYRLPGTTACSTCPRVDDAERAARTTSPTPR